MDDSTVFEFKLLLAGATLMVTGATLLHLDSSLAVGGFLALAVGLLVLLGGLTDQSARFETE